MIILAIIGLILDIEFLNSTFLFNLLGIILIIGGSSLVYGYYKGQTCSNCNKKSILPIDDPKALKLIKEYDLQPGVNNVLNKDEEVNSTFPTKTS